MNRFIKYALLGCMALLVACSQDGGSSNKAPDANFTSLNNDSFTTADLHGKVVLVKFWATDCTTCVAQMPDSIDYYNRYHDQGFELVAVAMAHDPENYVRNFTESRQLPFTVVRDSDGEISKAFGDIRLTPTAFLIDRNGNIVRRYVGNYDKQTFTQTLERALAG